MNYFPEYGQAVTYQNKPCFITGRRSFIDSFSSQKITMYRIIAKHFEDWVDERELTNA